MEQIFERQSKECNLWRQNSGYLSFIVDNRDPNYIRYYVGQSQNPASRIKQHMKAIVDAKCDTLHYYVVWKGEGHRRANFIRLWNLILPEKLDESIHNIFNNILEMVMARLFQSLPSNVLKTWFGVADEGPYSKFGLNVVPPLYQGISLEAVVRQEFKVQLNDSLDSDIRSWPEFRRKQCEENPSSAAKRRVAPMLKISDYQNVFWEAVDTYSDRSGFDWTQSATGDVQFENMLSSLQEYASFLEDMTGTSGRFLKPFGTTKASIGMVLGESFFQTDSTQTSFPSSCESVLQLPWGLLQSGFTESNVLVWSYNFRDSSVDLGSNRARPLSLFEIPHLSRAHQSLIQHSNCKVILLCGKNAEMAVISQSLSMTPIAFELREYNFQGYISIEENNRKRLYVCSPAPLSSLWSNKWSQSIKLGEVFRFAAAVTHTPRICPWFYSSAMIYIVIFRRQSKERRGVCSRMTPRTIDPQIRAWLYHKGFTTEEDLKDLERLGGSLIQGIMMLLHVLPSCPVKYKNPTSKLPPPPFPNHGKRGKWGSFETESIRALYNRLNEGMKDEVKLQRMMTAANDRKEKALSNIDSEDDIYAAEAEYANSDQALAGVEMFLEQAENLEEVETAAETSYDDNGNLQLSLSQDIDDNFARKAKSASLKRPSSVLSSGEIKTQISLLGGRQYRGHWFHDPQGKTSGIRFYINHELLLVPESACGSIDRNKTHTVYVEVKPKGESHPNKYALSASDGAEAARLGFRIVVSLSNGNTAEYYPTSAEEKVPMRAHSFVDWMEGSTEEEIATRKNRFVFIAKEQQNVPDHLKEFISGGYTDSDGRPIPKKRKIYNSRKKKSDES